MTTNQTIDGVPRELIERAISATVLARGPGSPTERDLRALLDVPAKESGTAETVTAIIRDICEHEPDDNPDSAHISIKALELILLQNLEGLQQPAAQPPVELVAWKVEVDGMTLHHRGPMDHPRAKNTPLYEQPAPVAVVMPERLQQVLKFLEGAENLDGHWFGEPGPTGQIYWWRNELRKALAETNLFANQQ